MSRCIEASDLDVFVTPELRELIASGRDIFAEVQEHFGWGTDPERWPRTELADSVRRLLVALDPFGEVIV